MPTVMMPRLLISRTRSLLSRSWNIYNKDLNVLNQPTSRTWIVSPAVRCMATEPSRTGGSETTDVPDDVVLRHLEGKHEGVAVVALNRPHAKNAISKNLLHQLAEITRYLDASRDIRVVILTSDVPGIFCAGADLKERITMKEEDVPKFVSRARQTVQQFCELPVPSIAAIDGHALGGGLELALGCDFRVASSNAKVGLVETKLAIIPGAGGTQRLPRLIGVTKAKRLIFGAKALSAKEAEEIGVVDHAVDQNEDKNAAYCKALELAEEILPQGPIALRMAKLAITHGSEVDLHSALKYEEFCYAQVIKTRDRIEGLKAFKEKRVPQYTGE